MPRQTVRTAIDELKVGKHDWPQWAGSHLRNNVTDEPNIPTDWDVDDRQERSLVDAAGLGDLW